MDKETLSNYGWIVICVLVLAVMIALASPFGTYVSDAVKSTTQGLFDVEQGALSAAGIDIADQSFDDGSDTSTPSPEELVAQGIVPEGGVYIAGLTYDTSASPAWTGGTTYTAGQQMPSTVTSNDLFIYGDYAYMYNRANNFWGGTGCPYQYVGNGYTITGFNNEDTSINGWQVGVIDASKSSYGEVLSNINGVDVTSLQFTFMYCTTFTTAPVIPSSVTNMNSTFYECTSLETAPVIPNSVTNMYLTFSGCTSLTGNIEINANPTNYTNCFFGTSKSITLSGSSTKLAEIAATANKGNVKVAE